MDKIKNQDKIKNPKNISTRNNFKNYSIISFKDNSKQKGKP